MQNCAARCPRSCARTLVVLKTLRPPATQVSAPRPPFANVCELSRNPLVPPLGCHNHPRSHAFVVKIQCTRFPALSHRALQLQMRWPACCRSIRAVSKSLRISKKSATLREASYASLLDTQQNRSSSSFRSNRFLISFCGSQRFRRAAAFFYYGCFQRSLRAPAAGVLFVAGKSHLCRSS